MKKNNPPEWKKVNKKRKLIYGERLLLIVEGNSVIGNVMWYPTIAMVDRDEDDVLILINQETNEPVDEQFEDFDYYMEIGYEEEDEDDEDYCDDDE